MWKLDKPSCIFLGNEGDLSEAVTGHYASQAFTVDLDQREQDRVVRRLLFKFVETAARRAPKVFVSGVACNHGENRGPWPACCLGWSWQARRPVSGLYLPRPLWSVYVAPDRL